MTKLKINSLQKEELLLALEILDIIIPNIAYIRSMLWSLWFQLFIISFV